MLHGMRKCPDDVLRLVLRFVGDRYLALLLPPVDLPDKKKAPAFKEEGALEIDAAFVYNYLIRALRFTDPGDAVLVKMLEASSSPIVIEYRAVERRITERRFTEIFTEYVGTITSGHYSCTHNEVVDAYLSDVFGRFDKSLNWGYGDLMRDD
jgi:hypothetical protein